MVHEGYRKWRSKVHIWIDLYLSSMMYIFICQHTCSIYIHQRFVCAKASKSSWYDTCLSFVRDRVDWNSVPNCHHTTFNIMPLLQITALLFYEPLPWAVGRYVMLYPGIVHSSQKHNPRIPKNIYMLYVLYCTQPTWDLPSPNCIKLLHIPILLKKSLFSKNSPIIQAFTELILTKDSWATCSSSR